MPTPRKAAFQILMRVDQESGYSNLLLDAFLKKADFEPRDAAFVTALVYGVVEHLLSIDYLLAHFSGRNVAKMQPAVRNILRLGACQLLFMDKIPPSAAVNESVGLAKAARCGYAAGFVNAVLRKLSANREVLPWPDEAADPIGFWSVRYSVPAYLVEKWASAYGMETARSLIRSLSEKAPHAARVNTLRTDPETLIKRLADEGIAAELSQAAPDALVLDRAPELRSLPSFREGLFYMQDFASQLCCRAADPQPGERVLDLCAAPGGKSFTMGLRMGGKGSVTACDLYESRLALIDEGARRLGLTNIVHSSLNDAAKPNPELGEFDRVLCDVPCSGLGVIRRKPEIRYKKKETFDLLPELQYSILCEGARHVRQGGRLVYSTCTLNPDENESVAQRFLSENSGFAAQALPEGIPCGAGAHFTTLFPHRDGTDGFFIACFQKVSG